MSKILNSASEPFEVKPSSVVPSFEAHVLLKSGVSVSLYGPTEESLRELIMQIHDSVSYVDYFSVSTVARQSQGRS